MRQKKTRTKDFEMAVNITKPPIAKCRTKWQPDIITQDASNQTVEVNGIPRHVKHIRPRNDTRSLCIVPDVEIEVVTDTCHGNGENHEGQIEDVLETQEEGVKVEIAPQEVDVPLRQSARERRMPSKYFGSICMIRKDQGGVLFRCVKFWNV